MAANKLKIQFELGYTPKNTRNIVDALKAAQVEKADICRAIGCQPRDLYNYCVPEDSTSFVAMPWSKFEKLRALYIDKFYRA